MPDTVTVNVSAPSVVLSTVGVTVNDPALLLIVTVPEEVPKSPSFVTDQFKTVPFGMFDVPTLIVAADPSSTEEGPVTVLIIGVAGVIDVSLIINVSVATIVPPCEPVLMVTVAVSAPSVVVSAVGVTEKLPALLLIATVPAPGLSKSTGVSPVVTLQYNTVPFVTLVVVTFIVPDEPSSIEEGGETA